MVMNEVRLLNGRLWKSVWRIGEDEGIFQRVFFNIVQVGKESGGYERRRMEKGGGWRMEEVGEWRRLENGGGWIM